MTLYQDPNAPAVEQSNSLPRSAPRGTGFLIRKRVKQKGTQQPFEEYHVTCDGKPISVYVPEYAPHLESHKVVGNPYKTLDQAQRAIKMFADMTATPVVLSEEFLSPDGEVVNPQGVVLPVHKLKPGREVWRFVGRLSLVMLILVIVALWIYILTLS